MPLRIIVVSVLLLIATSTIADGAGQWLVFTSYRDDNAEIYLVDSRGERLQNLTRHPAADMHPIWSPDGTTILFVSNRDNGWGIYEMALDGSQVQRLARSDYEIDTLAFSPDGSQISYITREIPRYGKTSLMLMAADGQNNRELTPDVHEVVWLPDGDRLFGNIIFNTLLVAIDAHTGEQTLFDDLYVGDFSIAPDGTRMAYDYGGEFSGIEIWDFATNTTLLLPAAHPNSEASDRGARWSPDGNLIAYMSQRSYGVFNIFLTEPDPNFTPYLLVNQPDFHNVNPVWSPDAAYIAFLADPSQEEYDLENTAFDIYVVDVTGENLINISNHPARDVDPQWQPMINPMP